MKFSVSNKDVLLSEEEIRASPLWMRPDAEGQLEYIVFGIEEPSGLNNYAIDDSYLDTLNVSIEMLGNRKIEGGRIFDKMGNKRGVTNLPECFGSKEIPNPHSYLLNLKLEIFGNYYCILVNQKVHPREFNKAETFDPRSTDRGYFDSEGLAKSDFPDYVPAIIETDIGIVKILDLKKLLKKLFIEADRNKI